MGRVWGVQDEIADDCCDSKDGATPGPKRKQARMKQPLSLQKA